MLQHSPVLDVQADQAAAEKESHEAGPSGKQRLKAMLKAAQKAESLRDQAFEAEQLTETGQQEPRNTELTTAALMLTLFVSSLVCGMIINYGRISPLHVTKPKRLKIQSKRRSP